MSLPYKDRKIPQYTAASHQHVMVFFGERDVIGTGHAKVRSWRTPFSAEGAEIHPLRSYGPNVENHRLMQWRWRQHSTGALSPARLYKPMHLSLTRKPCSFGFL
jgi:hypothetical protein